MANDGADSLAQAVEVAVHGGFVEARRIAARVLGSCCRVGALELELGGRERRLRPDLRIGADEEEARHDEHGRRGERPPAAEGVGEHDERQRERGDRGPRVGEEETDEEQAAEGAQPARTLPGGRDEQRDEQQVGGGERAEEGRDEAAQRAFVAGVVDEVLRQARDRRPVVESELLREPAGHSRVAPRLERESRRRRSAPRRRPRQPSPARAARPGGDRRARGRGCRPSTYAATGVRAWRAP